jgi:CMP-N,N'-diacetyllegionaminic acid synthase
MAVTHALIRPACLAVIPARGGSKGIPGKNLASAGGRPLIAWTIVAARAAQGVSRAVVSTDSPEIAEVARGLGAEIPFLRPAELATDAAPGMLPILHAIRWLEEQEGYRPDYVMCLQPTSPLRTAEDIDAALALARAKEADAVVSVAPVEHHPFWMKRVSPEGQLSDFMVPERPALRRQDLPLVHALNGAIYLVRREVLLAKQTWYTERTYAYVMPPERSFDVDTPWDLRIVDLLLGDLHGHGKRD